MEGFIGGIIAIIVMSTIVWAIEKLADIAIGLVVCAVFILPFANEGPLENVIVESLLIGLIGGIVILPILPYSSYWKDKISDELKEDIEKYNKENRKNESATTDS